LQVNGSVYLTDCRITGDGDIILGRGPAFFNHCELISNGGTYMWIRNTAANHGNVFLNCRFQTLGARETEIARAPTNKGKNYPYAEAVLLNCALSGISPAGWGPVGPDTSNIHYWEYNSSDFNGKPIDVSKRSPVSRQLTKDKDAEIITNYSNPSYALGGWSPSMAPIILSQPAAVTASAGQTATFIVKAEAIPTASFQWFKDGKAIRGETQALLKIENIKAGDAATYTVAVMNESSRVTSQEAVLTVK
jgi:pectinesterase